MDAIVPAWAMVRQAKQIDLSLPIHAGEREAIALAEEIAATAILLDDYKARAVAKQRGLLVTGTIGIMEIASIRGFAAFPDLLDKLQKTNFRCDKRLIQAALARHAARQG
jgi:predicted nucleic acid-binding protein